MAEQLLRRELGDKLVGVRSQPLPCGLVEERRSSNATGLGSQPYPAHLLALLSAQKLPLSGELVGAPLCVCGRVHQVEEHLVGEVRVASADLRETRAGQHLQCQLAQGGLGPRQRVEIRKLARQQRVSEDHDRVASCSKCAMWIAHDRVEQPIR